MRSISFVERDNKLMPIEIKSGKTLSRDSFAGLEKWCALAGDRGMMPSLIYGGSEVYQHKGVRVSGWQQSGGLLRGNERGQAITQILRLRSIHKRFMQLWCYYTERS